jgi:anaphase-promoting complex subunit 10
MNPDTSAPQDRGFPTTLAAGWTSGYYITRALAPAPGLPPPRCVNDDAVWVLSSAKPGNGIPQLLSDNVRVVAAPTPIPCAPLAARLRARAHLTTLRPHPHADASQLEEFWQSDGTAPHVISIQFRRRTALSELAFYVDHAADESYTPKTVSLRAGSLHHDLEELRRFELPGPPAAGPGAGPVGWVRVPLGDPTGKGVNRFLRTWYLQLMVMGMHANGRDLHIRCSAWDPHRHHTRARTHIHARVQPSRAHFSRHSPNTPPTCAWAVKALGPDTRGVAPGGTAERAVVAGDAEEGPAELGLEGLAGLIVR